MKTIDDAVRDFHDDPVVAEGLRLVESLPEEQPHDEVGARRDQEAAQRRRLLHEMVNVRGVPFLDAQQVLFGELEETSALAAARVLQKKPFGAILCLAGPNGVGKSLAASWSVIQGPPRESPWGSWRREQHPRFLPVGEFQRLSLYTGGEEWRALLEASVLAIDDLGVEFNDDKGAFAAKLDQLVAYREKAPCWTILTTNLTVRPREQGDDSFAGRYGARVVDRLHRAGSAMLHLKGESLRRKTQNPKPTRPSR